jgi:thiol-disulfide isomerase/thioredoxin
MKTRLSIVIFILVALGSFTAFAQDGGEAKFPGVQQWEKALLAGDMTALQNTYSENPPTQFVGKANNPRDVAEEIAYWKSFRASGYKDLALIQRESGDQQGLHLVSLTLSFHAPTPQGPRMRYILIDQGWQQQGGTWRIAVAKRTGLVTMLQPTKLDTVLYPANADAHAEIHDAVARAGREHKRVILDFGANWCYDCHVLDYALHQPNAAKIAGPNFIVVHVDVGEFDKNLDLANQYKVPLKRGIPALAVLNSDGSLLYSQQNGEFESARSMDPATLVAFLNKWKP